jgi:hypothetical protein
VLAAAEGQRLAGVEHEQHTLAGVKAAVAEVGDEVAHHRLVLGRALDHAERHLGPIGDDPEGADHGGRGPVCPTSRMYSACMPNVQIRDVPDDVHAALVRRAERAGQSLQQFLAARLEEIASAPTLEEVLDRIEGRRKGRLSRGDAIDTLTAERARR